MNFKSCLGLTLSSGLLLPAFLSVAVADDTGDEASHISVLQSQQASPADKDAACVWIKRHGTAQSVPALEDLLSNEQLSQSARHALESMPGSEAENALIAGLAQTSGPLKAGVAESLGIRGDSKAVSALARLLTDPDIAIARAAASSLGDIATPEALTALEAQLKNSDATRQPAMIEGSLRCAQTMLAAGDHDHSLALYKEIYQLQAKEFYHVAAYRGIVLASPNGVDLIVDAVKNGPASIQMEAVGLVHNKEIPGVTTAIAALLPKVDPLVQVALIGGLTQRDDPEAAPAIVALAKQAAPEVRIAAVSALGTLGSDKDVSLLIDIAATAGDPAQASARQALELVNRGNPNQALMDMLASAKAPAQVEITKALTARSAVAATPQLLQLAKQGDESVRDAAFQALARLVDQPQLDTLVQLVSEMTTDDGRSSAANALITACRHIQRQHDKIDMTPVWTALKNGSLETRVALFPACSSFIDPDARAILRASLTDANANIHAAAVRAICDTADPDLIPDVTKLATDPANNEFRTIAIEACVRLATQEESITLSDSEKDKLFTALAPAASSAAEKRVVLAGLATLGNATALQLAVPLVTDGSVSNEAARTVIAVARKLPQADAAKAALEKIASQPMNDENRQNADAALKMVDARANYVTAWKFAGPYREAKKNYTVLFDTVFPPETDGAQGVNWQTLPLSDDAASPWVMDLLKAIGGEQEVAYARTSIHTDGEQTAWMLVNSDDGVKAWLNGDVVHANNTTRAINGEPDKVKVTLKPGWNELLLKVTQNNKGWGFCVRLTDTDGAPLKNIQCTAGSAPKTL